MRHTDDIPLHQIRNGPRRLLSRTGGRLPALQAVSKPDAKAERGRLTDMRLSQVCQGSVAETTQNSGSYLYQLFLGHGTRYKFTLAARTSAPIFETIKPRTGNRDSHIAFGPHFMRGKWVGQRMVEPDKHVIGHGRNRLGRAKRDNSYNVAPLWQSRDNNHHRPTLDHLWHDKAVEITQQNFTDFRVVHQRHLQVFSARVLLVKGRCVAD